jgi:TRAP-type C4-dicarboxylate transport system permease small subunit
MSTHNSIAAPQPQPSKVFGIPLGDMGFFHSLLIACIFGVIAFFATCFVAIFGLLIYNKAGHHTLDMADAYLYAAAPVGVVVLVFALVVLLGIWMRRKFSGR